MNALVIYSGGSNTSAVAHYIADKTGGKAVTVQEASSMDLNAYDKLVFGTRVRAGGIPSDFSGYVSKNKEAINGKSTAFFLCCLYNDDKGQRQLDKIASELGFKNAVYFNKGKRIVKEDGNAVDKFIDSF